MVLLTKALVAFASNDIDNASKMFFNVSQKTSNIEIINIALNNYSICNVYMKQISTAIETLEQLIQSNPVQHMIDPIIFNLATLYDLNSNPTISTEKKKSLSIVAKQYNRGDIDTKSFRI